MTPVEVEDMTDNLLARWQARDERYAMEAERLQRRRGLSTIVDPGQDMPPSMLGALVWWREQELEALRSQARAANVEDELLASEQWRELGRRLYLWAQWLP